jgi:hypothetical protein
LACVTGRGCVCILVWVNVLLSEAEPWVDPSVGGLAPGWVPRWEGKRVSKRARSRTARSVGSSVCVCLRPCGSALEPPGTHRNAASLGSPGLLLSHKEVAARKKGGKGGRNTPSPTRASNKGQFIRSSTGGSWRQPGQLGIAQDLPACPGPPAQFEVWRWGWG